MLLVMRVIQTIRQVSRRLGMVGDLHSEMELTSMAI
jgi:hypothetical protein